MELHTRSTRCLRDGMGMCSKGCGNGLGNLMERVVRNPFEGSRIGMSYEDFVLRHHIQPGFSEAYAHQDAQCSCELCITGEPMVECPETSGTDWWPGFAK